MFELSVQTRNFVPTLSLIYLGWLQDEEKGDEDDRMKMNETFESELLID